MSERRAKTCSRRARPSVPLSLKLDCDKAETVERIAEQTGKPVANVLETMVLYALSRAQLTEVTCKMLTFGGIGEDEDEDEDEDNAQDA